MRLAALAALAVLLLAPAASASQELPVRHSASLTLPSEECPDCAGASASAGTYVPNCYDCDGVGAGAGASTDGDSVTAVVKVCKSGFVYFCPVDQEMTV